MILLDTHVWIWWVHGNPRLKPPERAFLEERAEQGLAVSIFSCWEAAKLAELGKLELPLPLDEWFPSALVRSGVETVDLTPEIIVDSTRLPGSFHRDPADQLIVATARVHDLLLATLDEKILRYPHVRTWEL